jgi:hypothetical protein
MRPARPDDCAGFFAAPMIAILCKPSVAKKKKGHCFGIVIYNENTNHNVWSDCRSVTRSPACAGHAPTVARDALLTAVFNSVDMSSFDAKAEILWSAEHPGLSRGGRQRWDAIEGRTTWPAT